MSKILETVWDPVSEQMIEVWVNEDDDLGIDMGSEE